MLKLTLLKYLPLQPEVKEEEEVAEDQEEEPEAEKEEEEGHLKIQAFHTPRHLYNQDTYKMEATIITDKLKMAPSINPPRDTFYVFTVGCQVTKGKTVHKKQLTGKEAFQEPFTQTGIRHFLTLK